MATPTQTFELTPRGPFSLELAATFGFGHRREQDFDGVMRLAFALDGLREHAGVVLRQDHAGAVHGQVDGVDPDSVEQAKRQIARILSLDHDGEAWLGVRERDLVMGALQRRHLGLRPVLFHSPYEAAAWGLISARQGMRQASAVRERIAARLGRSFELEGRELHAFPLPPALATLDSEQGLNSVKAERLRVLADRATRALTTARGYPATTTPPPGRC